MAKKVKRIEAQNPVLVQRKRVGAYARVSMESERLEHSLSAQISYYNELIQRHPEWEFAGVYADNGISGTSTAGRDEFNRMLADCEAGKINIILTKSISRFARNTLDTLVTVRRLKDLGIAVHFEKENIDTMTEEGELLLTLLASFAQEESRSISDNVKWGTRKRFEQGIPNGRFQIYGYRWEGDHLVIHPEEAKIVRLIYDNFLNGLSAETTEKQLATMGVKSYKGKHFGNGSIRQILNNITYTVNLLFQKEYVSDPITGKSKKNRGKLPQYWVENTHEAIIPMEIFQAVQAERQRRRELGVFANWSINTSFMTGKMKCPYCHKSYAHNKRTKEGHTQEYWVCGSRKEKKIGDGCPVGGTINHRNLIKACTEILELDELDEQVFLDKVDHIEVPARYTLTFFMKDGTTLTKGCPNTGHQDCWTPELRAAVGKARKGKNNQERFHNPFTGRIVCSKCGAFFRHQTTKYKDGALRIFWHCPNSATCGIKATPLEKDIMDLAVEAMGVESFDETTYHERVAKTEITGRTEVTFTLADGRIFVKTWTIKPRKSYPHTDEYKRKMSEITKERWKNEAQRQHMSEAMIRIRREKKWPKSAE